jgi:predicted AlkP superfamily pyrophosphatase or phosphodiesterase
MLPALPKSFGRLSEVFTSVIAAVSGQPNSFNFAEREKYVVILVDGLGSHNLDSAKGHARFLSSQTVQKISCWFPSTTAASLMSMSLGLRPGQHPFIGYQVFDRQEGKVINLLSGIDNQMGSTLRVGFVTADDLASQKNVAFTFIGPSAYENSGFTSAFLPNATYVAAPSVADRFEQAAKRLSAKGREVVYLYVPELDQIAHAKGWHHLAWTTQLEELDALVKAFTSKLNQKNAVVLTADHGVIDVEISQHIYLDEFVESKNLAAVAGDTRSLYLYMASPSQVDQTQIRLQSALANRATVVTPKQLREAGYWPDFTYSASRFQPDLIVLATTRVALYHRAFAKPQSLKMIAHHGSISTEELVVPLITWGA